MPNQYPEVLVQFLVSIFIGLFLISFIVLIITQYNRKKKNQQRELDAVKAAYEKELLNTQLEIQEDILKNVSMEIHDNIGQVLLLANINLSILQSRLPEQEDSTILKETKQIISRAMEDISQLSRSMHSDRISSIGVFTAISHELQILAKKKLFRIQTSLPESLPGNELSKETQLLIFRMYQEIIKNIIKHANASLVIIELEESENQYQLYISDNGRGFDLPLLTANSQSTGHGVGMRSLSTRVNLFNGKIDIQSEKEKGTSICIFIPRSTIQTDIQ